MLYPAELRRHAHIWLKHWVFRYSAVAAVFMISDGFRRPEISDEKFWFQVGGRLLQNDSRET